MNEIVRGYIYNKEGKYIEVKLCNTIENIANFIARCSSSSRVVVTDAFDQFMVSSLGNFLDQVYSPEYREELLKSLLPKQLGSSDAEDVKFIFDEDDESYFNCTKEKFIQFVKDKTSYSLVD